MSKITTTPAPAIDLRVADTAEEAVELLKLGFFGIEVSAGALSVDGPTEIDGVTVNGIDHHGRNSHLEAVSLRSYRDMFAVRKDDPRFVVVGTADLDAVFATAALAGILPHPSVTDFRGNAGRDLTGLAETIAKVDTDPIGVDLTQVEGGDLIVAWHRQTDGRDTLGALGGLALLRQFTTANPAVMRPFFEAAHASEADRREAAKADLANAEFVEGVLTLDGTEAWGFDVWYARRDTGLPTEATGWDNPVVVTSPANAAKVTIACPNTAVAEGLFGPGGLKNVFAALGEDWSGRESIGGSPRGQAMTREDLFHAAKVVAGLIRR